MDTFFSLKPLLAVLVSLIAVVFILIFSRRANVREFWSILAAVVKFGIVFSMLPAVLSGQYPEIVLFEVSPAISLALRVDMAGIIFATSASLLWIVTTFYSIGYMRGSGEHKQTRYFASFCVCLSATMGIAFSANLLTLVIFYEILTLATYPLVIHKETQVAMSAGRKYLLYLLTGGLALIVAVALTYHYTGTLDFTPGGFLTAALGDSRLIWVFILYLVGFGMKAAIMPFHSWLPTAMAAPTPVSALLHAVAVVKAGVFGFVRVIGFVFGPALFFDIGASNILAIMAGITIILSSLLAFKQDNLKRRLAYSTVGHLSYIVLGLALFAPSAWIGGLLHLVNHATMKITLFFCAGAIYVKAHKENISDLNGIGRQMPITLGAFTLASIGLMGVPPINGFISKWFLGQGALEADQGIYLGLLLLSGLLNAGYFFPIIRRAFFQRSQDFTKFSEASPFMVVPLVFTALLSLLLGIWPDFAFHLYSLAREVAFSIFAGGLG